MPGTQTEAETTQTPTPGQTGTAVHRDTFDQEAHDRAAYRRLVQDTAGEPDDSSDAPQGAAAVQASQAAKPHPSQPKVKSEPPKGDATIDPELAAIADATLRRDGLPDAARKRIIDGASPEELQTIVEKRRKVQQDTDRLGNVLAQARRTPTGNPKGEQNDDQGAGDLTEGLTPKQAGMVQKLMAEGDEERAQELATAFRDGTVKTGVGVKHEQREDNQPPQRSTEEVEAILLVRLQQPLEALRKDYPALNATASQLEVIRSAQKLIQAGVFEGQEDPKTGRVPIETILSRACEIKLGTLTPQQRQRQMIERNHAQRNGQPNASPARAQGDAPLTPEQRERTAYRLLQEGKSADEVQTLLGRR